MSKPFFVDTLCICEYATQDISGRALLAGVFPGMIGFDRAPSSWPQYFIFVSIAPRSKSFKFSIKLIDAQEEALITFNGDYSNDSAPDDRERIIFLGQIPPVKFTGAGNHELAVMQGKNVIESRAFPVFIGNHLPLKLGEIKITHKIKDAD